MMMILMERILLIKHQYEVTTLHVEGEGTWNVDTTTGEVTFTPDPGVTKDPTAVHYIVSDKDGNKSNPAIIDVRFPENRKTYYY